MIDEELLKESKDITKSILDTFVKDNQFISDIQTPSHYYNEDGTECKDIIRDILGHNGYMDYCRGAVIKYLFRYRSKEDPLKDLGKAKQYIIMMMDELQDAK